jgi:subfamily B ATP-binding cassette protein MsbA
MAAADRVFEVIDSKSEVPDPVNPAPATRHTRNIEFEDISFRYRHCDSDANHLTLQNINLKIPFGEVVAVVGGNGSGKSTLISLLPRLLDPLNGTVKIDGRDIRQMSLKDLRHQIGLVTQDTMLFDESIYDNVLYGNPEADSSDIEQAIQQAHAADFVALLPKGLNTKAGLKGQKLSGGQKQRIALARAIVRDPAILIMDEATSAIDAESEAIIYKVLQKFARGRTVFIITHLINQSFLDLIDRVVVLEHGRIVANGKHEDLIGTCPEYSRLVQAESNPRAAA